MQSSKLARSCITGNSARVFAHCAYPENSTCPSHLLQPEPNPKPILKLPGCMIPYMLAVQPELNPVCASSLWSMLRKAVDIPSSNNSLASPKRGVRCRGSIPASYISCSSSWFRLASTSSGWSNSEPLFAKAGFWNPAPQLACIARDLLVATGRLVYSKSHCPIAHCAFNFFFPFSDSISCSPWDWSERP